MAYMKKPNGESYMRLVTQEEIDKIKAKLVSKERPINITDIDQEPTKNPAPKLGFVSLDDVLDRLEERKNIYREMNFDDDSEQIQELIHIQADMLTLKRYRF